VNVLPAVHVAGFSGDASGEAKKNAAPTRSPACSIPLERPLVISSAFRDRVCMSFCDTVRHSRTMPFTGLLACVALYSISNAKSSHHPADEPNNQANHNNGSNQS